MRTIIRKADNLVILILVSTFCGFSVQCNFLNREQPVAHVNDAELTRAELELMVAQIGPEEDYLNAQRKFVYDWVDRELLYQEALQQNIEPTPFMEAELERVRKSMIINAFLKSKIDSIISVSDNEIQEHYETHTRDFIAETQYYKFVAIKTADAAFAKQLDKELNNGSDIENIRSSAPDKCRIVSNGFDYIPETLINPTIAAQLQKQKDKKNFSKYTVNGEVYFIKVVDTLLQGEAKTFDMVAQEIKQMLTHNKRQERYNDLISHLRKNYSYEINLNILPDSAER